MTDMDVFRRYQRFLYTTFVDANRRLRWCPGKNCGKVTYLPLSLDLSLDLSTSLSLDLSLSASLSLPLSASLDLSLPLSLPPYLASI